MFNKFFKLKKENAKRIKELIKIEDEVNLKIISLKSDKKNLFYGDVVVISFVDDKVLSITIDDEVLGKFIDIDYDRLSQSLVSRLIAASHSLIPSLPEEEDFEGFRDELDDSPVTPQETQEDKSGEDEKSEPGKSLEELLLEEASRTPEVSQSSDALPSDDVRELLEEDIQEERGEAGEEKAGSSQPNQTSGENSSGACTSGEPVATGEVSTHADERNQKGQVQDCPFTKKELEKIRKEIKEMEYNLKEDIKIGKGKVILLGVDEKKRIEEDLKKAEKLMKKIEKLTKIKSYQSKTEKKLIEKIKKTSKRIRELKKEVEKEKRKMENKNKTPRRDFNLPYCYIPTDTELLDIERLYKVYMNDKQHKRIKKLFKKLLDEIGCEETPRIDKKKLVLNLAKYKNPYNSYKQEAEKSYLLLLVDLSGSMASFEELKYPAYAISKEHENIIVILNVNAIPFGIIKDGKVVKVDVYYSNFDKALKFYEELIRKYNVSSIISISDWDGIAIYNFLMKNTNAKWIWCDPYCCSVCDYIPQKEEIGKYLPDTIKPFKNKISYWYAVGSIDGFISVLEKET